MVPIFNEPAARLFVVALELGPSLLQERSPHHSVVCSVRVGRGEVESEVHQISSIDKLAHNEELVVNVEHPRLSSDVELNLNDPCRVLLLGSEHVSDELRELGDSCETSHYITVSNSALDRLSPVRKAGVTIEDLSLGVSISPAVPVDQVVFIVGLIHVDDIVGLKPFEVK